MSNNIIKPMPKNNIDYSNTIVYKLVCKDEPIKDVYVGHTTNFTQRKYSHRMNCVNENRDSYNLKVYDCIRKNGGWENWEMIEICNEKCANKLDALRLEHHYYSLLNANLNSRPPFPNKNNKHNNDTDLSQKELKNEIIYNSEKKTSKIVSKPKFECQKCKYYTNNLKDLKKHEATNKHINALNNIEEINAPIIKHSYVCKKCGESFNTRMSMWRHNKRCEDIEYEPVENKNDIVSDLLNQNKELQNIILEQSRALINSNERIIELSNIISNFNKK